MDDSTVTAGALAEHAAPTSSAAAEATLELRQHLSQQIVLPRTHGSGVYVLIAAQAGEAVRECHHHRRHTSLSDQSVEPLRYVFLKRCPPRVRQAATGEPDQVDQQGEIPAVAVGRHIDIYEPVGWIPKQIVLQDRTCDR